MQEVTSLNLGPEIGYHKYFRGFTQSLKVNIALIPYNRLRLLSSIHFPIHIDVVIVGYDAVSPSSALKKETLCLSETLVSTYRSTRCHNPEEQHRHPHRREDLKSHISNSSLQSSDYLTQ
jgi:hypothetical protein